MTLIRLQSSPLADTITSQTGDYKDPCDRCLLGTVCVRGCCQKHGSCTQETCHRDCNDCGGGDELRGTGANVPAICSKAPLRELYLQDVMKPHYDFTSQPLINLKSRAIIVTQGSPGRVEATPYPKDCEAIAVNLRHVWSSRGWFSQDIRDYLKLENKNTKLILLSHTHDDVLERAWDAGVHHDDIATMGFDHWQGLEFSQYGDMSRYNNLWLGYRSLYAIEASKAHFTCMLPGGLNLAGGLAAYRQYHECGEAIPQLMVNWQYTSTKDPIAYKWMVAYLRRTLKCVPVKAIWFMGVVSADMAYNLQRAFPKHRCYYLAVNPWLAAHKGDEFQPNGRLKKSKLPKLELVLRNQHNYANLIAHAVKTAKDRNKSAEVGARS